MASKYANLPDIDTSNPDVYETPDVPASFSFGHDSDSDGEYGNESNIGLAQSPSSSHLLNAARQSNGNAANLDDAIDQARLRPGEARSKFVTSKTQVDGRSADFSPALVSSRRNRYPTSLLPESTSYSVRSGNGASRGLSSTARRQLRTQSALEADSQLSEPETKTERLRRLRFEMEELENELEADKEREDQDGEDGASECEEEDTLAKRDDADKTRPQRRRKKKRQVDENGELSPAVLLSQLKRLRSDLSSLGVAGSAEGASNGTQGSVEEHKASGTTKELLQRIGKGRPLDASELEAGTVSQGVQSKPDLSEATSSRIDARLEVLEKYVGANEADVEETRPLPPPLLSTLAKLEHQLHLLTQPRHLDTISRRVKVLVTDLERVHEARRKIGDTRPLNVALGSGISISTGPVGMLSAPSNAIGGTDQQPLPPDALQKIDGLFALLPRIDPLIPLAPYLVTRLRSLSTLHASAQSFSADLASSERSLEGLKQSEGFLRELLEGLQTSLESNQSTVKSNLEGLGARVEEVMRRVDSLNA